MVSRSKYGQKGAALSLVELGVSARYALRGLRPLARAFRRSGCFLLAGDIAREERLPVCFLSKIFQRLARKGLLQSRRGPGGGYALAADPGRLSLAEVVRAAQDVRGPRDCVLHDGGCRGRCAIEREARAADARLTSLLGSLTLSDMISGGV